MPSVRNAPFQIETIKLMITFSAIDLTFAHLVLLPWCTPGHTILPNYQTSVLFCHQYFISQFSNAFLVCNLLPSRTIISYLIPIAVTINSEPINTRILHDLTYLNLWVKLLFSVWPATYRSKQETSPMKVLNTARFFATGSLMET